VDKILTWIRNYRYTSCRDLLINIKPGVVLFRTMRSRDRNVIVVRRTINLGSWEFGMGREWGGVEKGEVSL
jgi:hypothetical protein